MSLQRTPRPGPPAPAAAHAGIAAARAPLVIPAVGARPTAQAVFAEHAAFVLRSVRRLGVRPSDVEDVAQEVFVIVHRKLDSWDGTSTMRTWLFGIALRVASDHRRKAHIRRERLDGPEQLPQTSVAAPQVEDLRRRELREQLARALDSLDAPKRAVFVLFELENVPMAEIAQSQGCPLFTAYGRLREAREHVRACFERELRRDGAATLRHDGALTLRRDSAVTRDRKP